LVLADPQEYTCSDSDSEELLVMPREALSLAGLAFPLCRIFFLMDDFDFNLLLEHLDPEQATQSELASFSIAARLQESVAST
jgi:hypothetical protein